ncbi:MAG TPA: hypothetical protein VMQ45_05735 [Burkholderiaceae bacterium]|nr:hypothetical protein [Burkholderiaceae bacterium]
MKAVATLDTTAKRGGESWTYFYVALGFALSIEGTFIGMIQPLAFPWNRCAPKNRQDIFAGRLRYSSTTKPST